MLLDEVVGELNPEQKEIAQILASNTRWLDQLITALIHFSQANANPAGLRREVVDMRALVREVVEQYRVRLRANSIGLKAKLQPVSVYGNREQLRTVIDNLLSNAVKYFPTGEIIRVALTTENEPMVFEVEDRGPGIDYEKGMKVFEPFYQGRNSRELGVQGTGLGLAIVRECVASHQGRVELVDPPTGRGTLVRVRIPLRNEGQQRLRVRISLPAEGKGILRNKACFLLAVVLGASSGCKNWFPAGSSESPALPLEPDYAASDLDSLIRYGERLTKMSPVQRLAECLRLEGLQRSDSRIGYRLHLLVGQLLVPDCGDPQATAAALRSPRGKYWTGTWTPGSVICSSWMGGCVERARSVLRWKSG